MTVAVLFLANPVGANDHAVFNRLLQAYVKDGQVNYRGFQKDSVSFKAYLKELANAKPDSLPSKEDKMAFWINAYNACVIKGVLEHYPIQSVRDVSGFFSKIRYDFGPEKLTLNDIERKARDVGGARVHFALVCASSSCPILRSEAYVPGQIDRQLAEQARQFLANPRCGLRLDDAASVAHLSQIFKWYRSDFTGEGAIGSLLGSDKILKALEPYMEESTRAQTERRSWKIEYMPYDWTLNGQ